MKTRSKLVTAVVTAAVVAVVAAGLALGVFSSSSHAPGRASRAPGVVAPGVNGAHGADPRLSTATAGAAAGGVGVAAPLVPSPPTATGRAGTGPGSGPPVNATGPSRSGAPNPSGSGAVVGSAPLPADVAAQAVDRDSRRSVSRGQVVDSESSVATYRR